MGITAQSLNRINKYLQPGNNILIIGCQNLYDTANYGKVAQNYFRELGYKVTSMDILGCQGSEKLDLREDLKFEPVYDVVNDCGSKEHVDGSLYWPFRNMHEACKVGGVMIHENPKTQNWPLHGHHYFTEEFYLSLSLLCKYDLLECTEEVAMGNTVDGRNVCSVLRKRIDEPFISEEVFNQIYQEFIKSK